MSPGQSAILDQIDRLDHPDAQLQDAILNEFSQHPDKVRPVVVANLPVVNARIRRALLRWLRDWHTEDTTLPLMRYVFDERGVIAEQTGRTIAMRLLLQRAQTTESPEEHGRLRAFAEEMCDDEDPDIRRLALRMLAFVGNHGSVQDVEPHLNDHDLQIREAAQKAIDAIGALPEPSPGKPDRTPAKDLVADLLHSAGPRRRQFIRQWRRHEKRTSIAVELLRRGGELREQALRILLEEPTLEARPFLASIVLNDPDGDLSALALRLMAKIGDGREVGPDELEAVRRAFRSPNTLNQAASCAAIAAFGLDQFVDKLLALSQSRDDNLALEAARSLDAISDDSMSEKLHTFRQSLVTNDRRRRRQNNRRDSVLLVSHLLSAIRKLIAPTTIGVEALQRKVFRVLADAGTERPIRVTGLAALMASTPTEGLDSHERWDEEATAVLIALLERADRPAARRIALLLLRGAPQGAEGLDRAARMLRRSDVVDVDTVIVPLLDRSGSEDALALLEVIADSDDERSAQRARKILRRRRNTDDVIDVEFIPRNEDSN